MKFLELLNHTSLVAAHRGARLVAPENTLTALKESIGRCDFIEIDVQLSRDAVGVVMHDDTLKRTTDVAKIAAFKDKEPYRVCNFTLEELSMLDYGSWFYRDDNHKEPLLTLKRALEFIKANDIFMNVEIKDISDCFEDIIVVESIVKEIQDSGSRQNILLSSFRHEYMRAFKKRLPDVPTAALVEGRGAFNLLEYLRKLKVDAYHFDDKSVDEKTVKMLREAGFFLGVYTVNDPKRAKELFEMGVNYIFSDSLDNKLQRYDI
ncbi:glycerophosphodiester phosphodiesterase family protein [Sulfurimonas sp.]|uniref:glycerophosphodiester phosphodiesterase n=1 Tax=Sulfurimonas sp. TaxID=2022749 RepID=UPI0025D120FF|nr:glycerophosphodiester phosphodiesterase family protein [Sulfurimonas sp.]MCK9454086.1 glycerophosphodiester phosphodiesterase [Sulfurimonas sp.]